MKNKKIIFKFLPITIILFVGVLLTYSIFKEIKNLGFSLSISKPTYTVVFNSNGGTGSMANQAFKIGISQNLNTNTFTRTDYSFDEWNTEPDGSGNSYTDGENVNNLANQNGATVNLYAQWRANDITITYDSNGGSTPSFETKTITGGSTEYGQMPYTSKTNSSLIGWSLNKIPDDYHEVEYIEFNAGTYIDTGIIPTNHTTEAKFDFGEYLNNEVLFGTANSRSDRYYFYSSENKFSGSGIPPGVAWTTGIHTVIYNGPDNDIKLDGQVIKENVNVYGSTNLKIGNAIGYNNLTGKIYYVKITDKTTGNVVRNLIPVYHKVTKTIGLYDTVNNVFYPNSDSEAKKRFGKGPEIDPIDYLTELKKSENHTIYAVWRYKPSIDFDANGGTPINMVMRTIYGGEYGQLPQTTGTNTFKGWKTNPFYIPDDYQEVEYIRFTNGSYIDTGVIPKDHYSEVKFDYEGCKMLEHLFGTEGSSGSTTYYHFSTTTHSYYWGDNSNIHAGTWKTGPQILKFNGFDSSIIIENETINSRTRLYGSTNLLIGKSKDTANFEGLIYYFKIVNNRTGEVERNFVPVYRKSDNEIGLYDTITNKFYTNDGIGTFEKGKNVNYITENSIVEKDYDHTLYAIWDKPEYQVNLVVNNGTSDSNSKQVLENSFPTFTLSTNLTTYVSTVTCTNGQKGTILNDVLTVKNVTSNTTCTVTYSDAGSTVLYTDGTLIINEKSEDRAANIATHGAVTNTYLAFSNTNNYVFTSASEQLWYNEKNSIKKIEIGQRISPLSTAYWFKELKYLSEGDFTNLDTSRVTSMKSMFYETGNHNSVNTTFILTGLNTWNTSEVENMESMFYYAGYYAKTWNIGNISSWDTKKVENMYYMFYYAGYSASTSFESITGIDGSLDIYARTVTAMFYNSKYMKATINMKNQYTTNYNSLFYNAATNTNAEIVVHYDCNIENIDKMIATKSNNSNIVKGNTLSSVCKAIIDIHDGTVDQLEKTIDVGNNLTFTITPDNEGAIPAVSCSNGQTSSVSGNTLTVSGISLRTTCKVYYEDATVLYSDGTLIINEPNDSTRTNNQTLHHVVTNIYEPLSSENNYVFTSVSSVLWYNEKTAITSISIGQQISPTSTANWFCGLENLSSGDFTNLDTSNVTTMKNMFYQAGNNSLVNTSFILTGLDDWDTGEVVNMNSMFYYAGRYAKTWSIGNISNWNTQNVSDMGYMFYYAGNSASTSFESITGIDDSFNIYATKVNNMFNYSQYMKATLNIYSNPASGSSGYGSMFTNASTKTGSLITVNYSSATTNIDGIIGTKSTSSNVVKGVQLD